VNDEFEMMWKKSAMVCIKVLYQNLLGGTEENHRKPQSG